MLIYNINYYFNKYKIVFKNLKQNHGYKTLTNYNTNNSFPRYYPSPNKEWQSSLSSYNKNQLKNYVSNYINLNKITQSYFNTIHKHGYHKKLKTRRRLRFFGRLLYSMKRFFSSNTNVKQTNDKAIVTIYGFQRHSQNSLKRLYKLAKWIKKHKIIKIKSSGYKKIKRNRIAITKVDKFLKYKRNLKINILRTTSNRNQSRSLTKNQQKAFSYKTDRYKKKINLTKKDFIEDYNTKKSIFEKKLCEKAKLLGKRKHFLHHNWEHISLIRPYIYVLISLFRRKLFIKLLNKIFNKHILGLVVNPHFLFLFYKRLLSAFKFKVRILRTNYGNEIKIRIKDKIFVFKFIMKNKLKNLKIVNKMLFNIAYILYKEKLIIILKRYKFKYFKKFKAKYRIKYMIKYLRDEFLILRYLSRYLKNKIKFNFYTPSLKTLLDNLLKRKIELNLVNLKYLHYDSDILIKPILKKLRRQKKRVKRVLTNILKGTNISNLHDHLMAINENEDEDKHKDNLNLDYKLNSYKKINNSISNLRLFKRIFVDDFFRKIFVEQNSDKPITLENYIEKNLDVIKFKGLRGIRLEAKGRLSIRFGATRSQSHLKYKGSLVNKDYLKDPDLYNKPPKNILLRNEKLLNIQHSYKSNTRRIGSFGIKGWVSGN